MIQIIKNESRCYMYILIVSKDKEEISEIKNILDNMYEKKKIEGNQ